MSIIDLGEDESFVFKHPYFFGNMTFKFEGFEPEMKKDLENFVESVGAMLSETSKIVFVDIQETPSNAETSYLLSYLSDSVLAEEPLEIEDYKLSNSVQNANQFKFCCMNAKHIWKNELHSRYQSLYCKSCMEERIQHCDKLPETNNNINNTNLHDSNEVSNSNKEINHLPFDKSFERPNKSPQHEMNNFDINGNSHGNSHDSNVDDENNHASIQPSTCDMLRNNEVNNRSSRHSIEQNTIAIQSDDILKNSSCSKEVSKNSKTKKQSSINRWRRIRKLSSDSDTDSESAESSPTRKRKNKHQRLLSPEIVDNCNRELQLHVDNSNGEINDLPLNKSLGRGNNSFVHEPNNFHDSDDSVENYHASIQPSTSRVLQNNGVNRNKRNSSEPEIIKIPSDHDDLDKPSCSSLVSKKLKTNKQSSIDRWKKTKKPSSNLDTNSKRVPTRKQKDKDEKLLSRSGSDNDQSSSDSGKSSSVSSSKPSSKEELELVERQCYNMKEWWLHLPEGKPHPNFQEPDSKHRGRGRDYTFNERRLMISYLVINDLISDGTSRRPWVKMHKDGYLQDRTVESLNNHYRKRILAQIENFKLPKDIENKFIYDRILHHKGHRI